MTSRQYGTLKHLVSYSVDIRSLGKFSMTTLSSLIYRGWVKRVGNTLDVTDEGILAFRSYSQSGPNYRKTEKEITERVRQMLHISKLVMSARKISKVA